MKSNELGGDRMNVLKRTRKPAWRLDALIRHRAGRFLTMNRFIFSIVGALFLSGCYTTLGRGGNYTEEVKGIPIDSIRTHVFKYPKPQVFDALITALEDANIYPTTKDLKNGLISVGWRSGYSDFVALMVGPSWYRQTFMIHVVDTTTTKIVYELNIEYGRDRGYVSPTRSNYSPISKLWEKMNLHLNSQNQTP